MQIKNELTTFYYDEKFKSDKNHFFRLSLGLANKTGLYHLVSLEKFVPLEQVSNSEQINILIKMRVTLVQIAVQIVKTLNPQPLLKHFTPLNIKS